MGPLDGLRIVELGGIGPVPYAGLLLSDLGADVIRIDRPIPGPLGGWAKPSYDVLARGRRRLAVDLKNPSGLELVLQLVAGCDALIEGFRPGVAERLGIGPDECRRVNPKLVFGRMTGWGQDGPLAQVAGHDVNYISLTGALHAMGKKGEPPTIPLNLIGDFGGGAMFLALGVVSALFEAGRSGHGQVVDAAMVDGASSLIAFMHAAIAAGYWEDERESNMLDGAAHFYNVYETKDGKYVSIGSIEPQFYAELLEKTGLAGETLPDQHDKSAWSALRDRMAAIFAAKTRDEWVEIMEGSNVCFAPVLSASEAPMHPHNQARNTFVEVDGVVQPGPAPRFGRSITSIQRGPQCEGAQTDEILRELGMDDARIAALRDSGVVGSS
jgi:alpha-methylacyl-CoA racemase